MKNYILKDLIVATQIIFFCYKDY